MNAPQSPAPENYVDWSIVQALRALKAEPDGAKMKQIAAGLLRNSNIALDRQYEGVLHALLTDPDVDPSAIERAGWTLIAADGRLPAPDAYHEDCIQWLENDPFACALLGEAVVTIIQVEESLRPIRHWLLMSGESARYPNATAALIAQAALNGGAWPIRDDERKALKDAGAIEAAYLPPRPEVPGAIKPLAFVAAVTQKVAAQYEGWPYPAWRRVMAGRGESLRETIAALGPDAPQAMPEDAELLVAGCGTGQEPVQWARRFPQLKITAIDLSAASLAYAAERAAAAGVTNIAFERRDLHDAAGLGRRFDIILSSGVLHHLPDPEAGWAAIAGVLKPGGAMRLMLYSRIARLRIEALRTQIADLIDQPVDDDLLRAVRERLIAAGSNPVTASPDFFSLGGVHDLLLHRHEDGFDVTRIRAGIDRLGLGLLRFELPRADDRVRYQAENPGDPLFRDFEAWKALERRDPALFAGMYGFWCLKPGKP